MFIIRVVIVVRGVAGTWSGVGRRPVAVVCVQVKLGKRNRKSACGLEMINGPDTAHPTDPSLK
jgi:hypothetical protein